MTKGVLIFAHNNSEIDYLKIACINALMTQKNLGIPNVALVTSEGTLQWGIESLGQEFLDKCFEHIITIDKITGTTNTNTRLYRDTCHSSKHLPFYNSDHFMAYDLTPYDETLFIDADYLIQSDVLNNCWGSEHDVMIQRDVTEANVERNTDAFKFVDPFGIRMYWATVIYFKKTDQAEHLFQLAKHVFDNHQYYRDLYMLPGRLFRNDYAFSIAVHMLNGFENNNMIAQLPIGTMYKLFDKDDILRVNGLNDMTLLLDRKDQSGEFIINRTKGVDIHVMNKWAITRNADELLRIYS